MTAHQSKTWWRRVLISGIALAVIAFAYLSFGRWSTPSRLGTELFTVLSVLGVIFALLGGPFVTVDCLSRERREGTLGLLFLTDLKSYDIVLGKMGAASLDIALGLAAALPLAALPLLLGGVTLPEFFKVALALLNIMFLSLAVGILASACLTSGRSALGLAVGALGLLALGVPFVGEAILNLRDSSTKAAFFYMFCPSWTMGLCLDVSARSPAWRFWLNMAGMHGLAWFCLALAGWRTARSWRDLPVSGFWIRWQTRLERWRNGSAALRKNWRRFMLERNPIAWLEGRDWLQERVLFCVLAGSATFWALQHGRAPQTWPSNDWIFIWPTLTHYSFCVWIAIQSPRRLSDDKQSGALELILCTPVRPRQIIRGCMQILRRRFGRSLVAMLLIDAFLIYAFYSEHGGVRNFLQTEAYKPILCGLLVFPVQAFALARVGLYQGLVTNSLRATFILVWKLGLFPWIFWFASLMLYDLVRQQTKWLPNISGNIAIGSWIVFQLFCCALFLFHAQWHLQRNFRQFAALSVRPAWWKRLLRWRPNPI